MNDFFTTQSANTVTINGNIFTAQDLAKIMAFGNGNNISWDGSNTWVSRTSAIGAISRVLEPSSQEDREILWKVLHGRLELGENADRPFINVIDEACTIVQEWAATRLHTCLKKKDGYEVTKFIQLDRLEAALGIEFTDAVRMRLANVTCYKDSDGEWVFKSATGKSYRETATAGILTEIHDAVNLMETLEGVVVRELKKGRKNLAEIDTHAYSFDLSRMTADDVADIEKFIENANITPDVYTVYQTKHGGFSMADKNSRQDKWDYFEDLAEFDTYEGAWDFMAALRNNFEFQQKRNNLTKQIEELKKDLEAKTAQLEKMCS